jgi:hypothetical protein
LDFGLLFYFFTSFVLFLYWQIGLSGCGYGTVA